MWEIIPFSLWRIWANELKCQVKERQMPICFMATQSEFNAFSMEKSLFLPRLLDAVIPGPYTSLTWPKMIRLENL